MKRFIPVVFTIATICYWPAVQEWGWHLYGFLDSLRPGSSPAPMIVTIAAPASKTSSASPPRHTSRPEAVIVHDEPQIEYRIVEPASTVETTAEPAPSARTTHYDPYESKAKRGIKAVGRFFKGLK